MGVSATSIVQIWDTGATTNGGGFDSTIANAGTDYSKQTSAQAALTGLTSAGAGNVLLCGTANTAWIGNWICMTGGTNVNQGFYQITGATANTDITLSTRKDGTSVASGVVASGTGNVGGAFKLGATSANRTDDDFFEAASNSGGAIYYIKGSHTTGGAISIAATGTATAKNMVVGFSSTNGDNPSIASGNQPSINCGANALVFGTHWEVAYCTITGTAAAMTTMGGNCKVTSCKLSNTSGTANRTAITLGNVSSLIIGCDLASTNGYAAAFPNANVHTFIGCRIHDSVSGIRPSAAFSGNLIVNKNIISGCSTAGIDLSAGAFTGQAMISGNTLYGASTPAGIGLSFAASSGGINLISNIIANWTTGVSGAGAITAQWSLNNNFSGNTTDRTNWSSGTGDIALAPSFTNAGAGDFSTGTNMQQVGGLGSSFPAGLTPTYEDIGASRSNYAGWFTDVDLSKIDSAYSFKYNTLGSNNRTGTATIPSLTDTKTGVAGYGGTGTYDGSDRWTSIPAGKVLVSQGAYKANSTSNNVTPTYDDTNLVNSNVKSGVTYGVTGVGSYTATGGSSASAGVGKMRVN
jgi:hypothetical protein